VKSRLKHLLFSWIIFLSTPFVFAIQPIQAAGLGDLAEKVVEGPLTIILNLVDDTCYILGAGLILASISKYFTHRRSPQMVPISTVFVYLILGILTCLLPLTLYLMNVPITLGIL
jgi:hypothetical protein